MHMNLAKAVDVAHEIDVLFLDFSIASHMPSKL